MMQVIHILRKLHHTGQRGTFYLIICVDCTEHVHSDQHFPAVHSPCHFTCSKSRCGVSVCVSVLFLHKETRFR
jgi:hypothetical protein